MKLGLALVLATGCVPDTGVHADVAYDLRFGDATTMDIHVPKTGTARPAVMMIHGGAWFAGEKEDFTTAAKRFATAGYVAATINYRLVPTGTYPAAVQDCLCALSFLRHNAGEFGIDPQRIAVTGYSAGGHLSALVGTAFDNPAHQPDCAWGPSGAPNAVMPGDAGYDFTEDGGKSISWITDFLGGTIDEVPDNYINASPLLNVRPGLPPFLVLHGDDDIVPNESAQALVLALRAAGGVAKFLDLDGAGHIESAESPSDGQFLQAASDTPEAWAAHLDFLAQTIGAP